MDNEPTVAHGEVVERETVDRAGPGGPGPVAAVVDVGLTAVDVTAVAWVMHRDGFFHRRHLLAGALTGSSAHSNASTSSNSAQVSDGHTTHCSRSEDEGQVQSAVRASARLTAGQPSIPVNT
ncbi:hypothetical protein SAMN02787118_114124 [Streptomyces mirabilis]|uniref:Uncharacterized protein n=1 Tax=Streptomyces mirabilis TaxID=68239 RepID=A0A1I2N6N7_9ACTN|nr:hypothetical protein SAMN02787118_114124 [Streptomyces mirabilis]